MWKWREDGLVGTRKKAGAEVTTQLDFLLTRAFKMAPPCKVLSSLSDAFNIAGEDKQPSL